MSVNSVSGYSFLGDYGKADAAAPSSSVTASAYSGVVQKDSQKLAETSTPSIPNATSDSQSTVAESSLNSTGEGLTQKNPVDSNWKVNGQNAFVITPNSRYVVNPPIGAAAQWIGPEKNSGVGLLPSGIYSYSYVFDGKNITSISGEFASDNETTDILLNGSSLKIHNDFGNSFTVLTPFTFHPIQGQLNTITFLVQNWGNYPNDLRPSPTGLYVRFQESVAKKACPQFETMLSEAKDIQKLADKLERDDKAYFDAVIDIIIRGYSSPYAVYMLDVSSEEIPKLFKDETQIRAVRSQLIEHIRTKARNRKKFADTGINGDFIPDAPVYSKENIELFCTLDSSKFTKEFWDSLWMAGYIDYNLYTQVENQLIVYGYKNYFETLADIATLPVAEATSLSLYVFKVGFKNLFLRLTELAVGVIKQIQLKALPRLTIKQVSTVLPEGIASNFKDGEYINRLTQVEETFYRYHGKSNLSGNEYVWFTTKKYTSEEEVRNGLAIAKEWGIELDSISTIRVPKNTWLSEGKAASQIELPGGGFKYPGGEYQAVIKNIPKDWVITNTEKAW